uniref:G-protein coupled receptors family 1 profile domain-containing protein n=1 Tax=Leptobrachium leishanense TaxID=445787 RepID=A0A8C5PVA5_9ANUR
MFVFGVVGNLIAIVVLCKSRKEQKETTFYTRVYGPVTIATYVQNRWPKGDQLIICAMSIERYLAINHAYFYNHFEDKKLAGLTLCAIYASNVLFCTLPSMGLGKTTYLYPQTWCFIDWRTNRSTYAAYSYMCAGFSSFLILVTVLCNVLVCVAPIRMRRQFMRRTSLGTDAQISDFRRCRSFRRIAGAEIQMVILLIATSVVILICSIPLVVIPSQPCALRGREHGELPGSLPVNQKPASNAGGCLNGLDQWCFPIVPSYSIALSGRYPIEYFLQIFVYSYAAQWRWLVHICYLAIILLSHTLPIPFPVRIHLSHLHL